MARAPSHPAAAKTFAAVICESVSTRPVVLQSERFLYRQDDPCDGLYVLQHGEVELLLESDVRSRKIARFTAPAVIGLEECLSGEGRCSSVRAIRPSSLRFAKLDAVRKFLMQDPTACLQAAGLIGDQITASLRLLDRLHHARSTTRKRHGPGV